jgi:hypothetical protein
VRADRGEGFLCFLHAPLDPQYELYHDSDTSGGVHGEGDYDRFTCEPVLVGGAFLESVCGRKEWSRV